MLFVSAYGRDGLKKTQSLKKKILFVGYSAFSAQAAPTIFTNNGEEK